MAFGSVNVPGIPDAAAHIGNVANPHKVTKTQVGLGNVNNTSDADKPVSTAQQKALDKKQDKLTFDPAPVSGSNNPVKSGGIYSALKTKAPLSMISNPNLLDNWYFVDPVNQRGLTEYTTAGYTIDRWLIGGAGSIKVQDDGILIQKTPGAEYITFDNWIEKSQMPASSVAVTLSAVVNGMLITSSGKTGSAIMARGFTSNGLDRFEFIHSSPRVRFVIVSEEPFLLQAVKFELGTQQTLAHQDKNGNWILNDPPPDKAMEAIKFIGRPNNIDGKDINPAALLTSASNPNLLDNWYFADPIDQRNGYIVNSGVTYYSDAGLTTVAGTTTEATTAKRTNSTYGTITIGNTLYYVAAADVARGYAARHQYTIDRWYVRSNSVVKIENDCLVIDCSTPGTYRAFNQRFEHPKPLLGKVVTLSALILESTSNCTLELVFSNTASTNSKGIISIPITPNKGGLYSVTGQIPDSLGEYSGINCAFWIGSSTGILKPLAMKLELGSQQTLAHQDVSGNWILNDPPPDKALELLKCQRYFETSYPMGASIGSAPVFSSNYSAVTGGASTTIKMVPKRANPAVTIYSANEGTPGKVSIWYDGGYHDTDAQGGYGGTNSFAIRDIVVPSGKTASTYCQFHWVVDADL